MVISKLFVTVTDNSTVGESLSYIRTNLKSHKWRLSWKENLKLLVKQMSSDSDFLYVSVLFVCVCVCFCCFFSRRRGLITQKD